MKILIATSNPGKFKEISTALANLPFTFLSLKDFQLDSEEVIEDGETYQENAFKKASFFAQKTNLITLSDDSGIIVEALKGELGVKTRRWGAGENATDQEWLKYFLNRMHAVENRTAKFISCACLVNQQGELIKNFLGETIGALTKEPLAPIYPGIPLSSCFIPDGNHQVYAQLTPDEKNRISHRGKAIQQVKEYLQNKPF